MKFDLLKKIGILGTLGIVAGAGFLSLRGQIPSRSTPRPAPSSIGLMPRVSPSVSPSFPAQSQGVRAGTEFKLKESLGDSVDLFFGPDGRLGEIRGRMGATSRKVPNFQPKDAAAASARGKAILESVQDSLGVAPGFPLVEVHVQIGVISAQVTYQQSLAGIPVEPGGRVVIDLGSHGELLGLSSEAWSSVNLINEVKLDSGSAGRIAVNAIEEKNTAMSSGSGSSVIWVSRPIGGGSPEGRHAYQFMVNGRMVVVDASSGAVLKRRDVRIH